MILAQRMYFFVTSECKTTAQFVIASTDVTLQKTERDGAVFWLYLI